MLRTAGYTVKKYDGKSSGREDPFGAQRKLLTLVGRSNPLIFDVGAHRGQTVSAYLDVFPDAHIHAFEPFPDAYRELRDRYANSDQVECIQAAVADSPREETFHLNHADATNSLLPRPDGKKEYYPSHAGSKGTMTVQTTTLDRYVEEHDIQTVDILKMDIQGGEQMALQGAQDLLCSNNVSVLYSEVAFAPKYEGQPLMHDVWRFVEAYGYSFFNLYDMSVARDGQLHESDAIFVSSPVRSTL
nr:FkbM family methyltransferase [Salinibacter ruber]